jgi:hypothetical protein
MEAYIITVNGKKIVEINNILFSGKRKIDWNGVEKYLKKYVGESYMIDEKDEVIFIGSDFPDEYTHSEYRTKSFGTVGKAKANLSQVIPEVIQIATDPRYKKNLEDKHSKDAMLGWYYYTIRFSLPITNDRKEVIGKNYFIGRMVIRHAEDGNKYLYDIVDIKKET